MQSHVTLTLGFSTVLPSVLFHFFSNFRSRKTTSCLFACPLFLLLTRKGESRFLSCSGSKRFASKHNQLFDVSAGALFLHHERKNLSPQGKHKMFTAFPVSTRQTGDLPLFPMFQNIRTINITKLVCWPSRLLLLSHFHFYF